MALSTFHYPLHTFYRQEDACHGLTLGLVDSCAEKRCLVTDPEWNT
jgi:hypothetical protein